jgi:hypothetical protein
MIVHNFFSKEEVKKAAWRMMQQGKDISVDMTRLIITEWNTSDKDKVED